MLYSLKTSTENTVYKVQLSIFKSKNVGEMIILDNLKQIPETSSNKMHMKQEITTKNCN